MTNTGLYVDDGTQILTTLDIHFSRPDRQVAICPFLEDDTTDTTRSYMPNGTPTATWEFTQGNCVDPATSTCITYDVECPDLDPWPETDVDEYLKNQSTLSWYGWF